MEIRKLVDLNNFRTAPKLGNRQEKKLLKELEANIFNADWITIGIMAPCDNKAIETLQSISKKYSSIKFDNLEFSRIFMAWFIPNVYDQKNIIGLEILASILSVGRNSRLVKFLKEDRNLVESVYVDVNAGELGGLFIMEASCESKDIDLVEKQINKILDEISNCKALALDEIKKAINIVKSNYIFNLETSTQLSSFFGNELLWGRNSSINNLEIHLNYWNDLDNFKEITEYIRGEKFTLVASPSKC